MAPALKPRRPIGQLVPFSHRPPPNAQAKRKTLDDTISVAVRVRPFARAELQRGDALVIRMKDKTCELFSTPATTDGNLNSESVATSSSAQSKMPFRFDKCYWSTGVKDPAIPHTSQEDIYRDVGMSAVNHVLSGSCACVIAHGPTNSGKTFTLFGEGSEKQKQEEAAPAVAPMETYASSSAFEQGVLGIKDAEEIKTFADYGDEIAALNPIGLMPRALAALVENVNHNNNAYGKQSKTHNLTLSAVEFIGDTCFDLLNERCEVDMIAGQSHGQPIFIPDGLTKVEIPTMTEALLAMKQAERTRAVQQTPDSANRRSNIGTLAMIAEVKERLPSSAIRRSRLCIVDLVAQDRCKVSSRTPLDEAKANAASILALTTCLDTVVQRVSSGLPLGVIHQWGSCPLTRLLSTCITGNGKTFVIGHVSPSSAGHGASLAALRWNDRFKHYESRATVTSSLSWVPAVRPAGLKSEPGSFSGLRRTTSGENSDADEENAQQSVAPRAAIYQNPQGSMAHVRRQQAAQRMQAAARRKLERDVNIILKQEAGRRYVLVMEQAREWVTLITSANTHMVAQSMSRAYYQSPGGAADSESNAPGDDKHRGGDRPKKFRKRGTTKPVPFGFNNREAYRNPHKPPEIESRHIHGDHGDNAAVVSYPTPRNPPSRKLLPADRHVDAHVKYPNTGRPSRKISPQPASVAASSSPHPATHPESFVPSRIPKENQPLKAKFLNPLLDTEKARRSATVISEELDRRHIKLEMKKANLLMGMNDSDDENEKKKASPSAKKPKGKKTGAKATEVITVVETSVVNGVKTTKTSQKQVNSTETVLKNGNTRTAKSTSTTGNAHHDKNLKLAQEQALQRLEREETNKRNMILRQYASAIQSAVNSFNNTKQMHRTRTSISQQLSRSSMGGSTADDQSPMPAPSRRAYSSSSDDSRVSNSNLQRRRSYDSYDSRDSRRSSSYDSRDSRRVVRRRSSSSSSSASSYYRRRRQSDGTADSRRSSYRRRRSSASSIHSDDDLTNAEGGPPPPASNGVTLADAGPAVAAATAPPPATVAAKDENDNVLASSPIMVDDELPYEEAAPSLPPPEGARKPVDEEIPFEQLKKQPTNDMKDEIGGGPIEEEELPWEEESAASKQPSQYSSSPQPPPAQSVLSMASSSNQVIATHQQPPQLPPPQQQEAPPTTQLTEELDDGNGYGDDEFEEEAASPPPKSLPLPSPPPQPNANRAPSREGLFGGGNSQSIRQSSSTTSVASTAGFGLPPIASSSVPQPPPKLAPLNAAPPPTTQDDEPEWL